MVNPGQLNQGVGHRLMTECLNCFGDKEIRLAIGTIDEPELEAFDEYEPDPSIVPLDYERI